MIDLYQAMDKVRLRFGERCLKRAVGIKTEREIEAIRKEKKRREKLEANKNHPGN